MLGKEYTTIQRFAPARGPFASLCTNDGSTSCGLRPDGTITCWGMLHAGGLTVRSHPPKGNFSEISCGHRHICALKPNGEVSCWGRTIEGELNVPNGQRFKKVRAGRDLTCGINQLDEILCWGRNPGFQLDGSFVDLILESDLCGISADCALRKAKRFVGEENLTKGRK